jgi:hypothetical protein
MLLLLRNRGDAVGIAADYGLDDRGAGVRVPVESRTFTSQYRPDQFWGPASYRMGIRGSFPGGKTARA